MSALPIGFGMGLLVAAQLGPMSLFLIRSVLRGSLATGLAIGAGIAVIDTLYAAAGAAGAAPVLTIDSVRVVFGVLGAIVLAVLGARTLQSAFRVRVGAEASEEVATPRRAFATSLAATASNPLTIASWAALFAAASVAGGGDSPPAALALLVGGGGGRLARVRRGAAGRCRARQPHVRDGDGRRGVADAPVGGSPAAAQRRHG